MINIIYEDFPENIRINSKNYPVVTDFRNWLRFSDMFSDENLSKKEKLILSLQWFSDTVPDDLQEAFSGLVKFASADEISFQPQKSSGNTISVPVLSYLYDSVYIFSAFLQIYNINLRNIEYMHWYEFRALLDGLPEDTLRSKNVWRTEPSILRKSKTKKNVQESKKFRNLSLCRHVNSPLTMPAAYSVNTNSTTKFYEIWDFIIFCRPLVARWINWNFKRATNGRPYFGQEVNYVI